MGAVRMGKAVAWVVTPILGLILILAMALGSPGTGAAAIPPGAGDPEGPAGPLNPAGIPVAYVPLLQAAGGKYCAEITAPALAAQIKQESGWNPNARSGAGAAGLAQFVPGTWASYARDVDGNGQASPYDPADAIDAQARYMCDLVAMFRGRYSGSLLDLAWAGYNAGPGNVQLYGGIPPFQETQAYVRILRANYVAYQQQVTAPAGDGQFANPLAGQRYVLTSGFGPRSSPGGIGSTWHMGEDMAIAAGTPIKAACSGVVTFASWDNAGGNATIVFCGSGSKVSAYYAHQTQRAAGIAAGARVTIGQVIGYVGSTGNSTGPHLHFGVLTNSSTRAWSGTFVDPLPFMRAHGAAL